MTLYVESQPVRPAASDALVPSLDRETGFFSLTSAHPVEWSIGVNLDSIVVLDCDAERQIRNVDVLIPESRWKRSDFEAPTAGSRLHRLVID